MKPEAWLRGPVDGVLPQLMPVAHALLQAREDLERVVPGLTPAALWVRPGGAASMGFHVRHIGGSIERLLTYAGGGSLGEAQRRAVALEGEPGDPPAEAEALLAAALDAIDGALKTIRTLPGDDLLAGRVVGRARLPSTVFGLLFHLGEHTTRHVGQLITTKKIVLGLGLTEPS
jgi:hypothetical protein